MLNQKKQTIGFFVLLAIAALIVLKIFWPFWELLAFAIILSVLFHPLYNRINSHTKMPNITAGFVVLIIALIIAGPVLLIGQQVFYELADFYKSLNLDALAGQSGNFINNLPLPLRQLAVAVNRPGLCLAVRPAVFTRLVCRLFNCGGVFHFLFTARRRENKKIAGRFTPALGRQRKYFIQQADFGG
jgi:hypothetical protein